MTVLEERIVHPAATGAVLVAGRAGLHLLPLRRRDTVVARLRAGALDHQLATGVPAETSRLLATRAAQLTAPRYRRVLARRFDDLVERAARPWYPTDSRVPVRRRGVQAARDHIERLTDRLRCEQPVAAAGVAAARLLLTDAGSPVYDLRRSGTDAVAATVERVTSAL